MWKSIGVLPWSAYFVRPYMGSIQDREPYILNYLIEFQNSIWLSCFGGYRKTTYFYLTASSMIACGEKLIELW